VKSIEIPQIEDRDWRYRALEILPGALTYTILALPIILSLVNPKLAAYFVITFLLIWFVRALAIAVRSVQGWRHMEHYKSMLWQKLIDDLEVLSPNTNGAPKWHLRNLQRVEQYIGAERIKPSEVYHAVIIAIWNELDVLESTIMALEKSHYDMKKVIMVIAYEERGGAEVKNFVQSLVKKYGKDFYHAEAVMHPWPMTGEVIGKGGNVTFAARRLKVFLEQKKIAPEKVLVTTLDCDNRPDKDYLSALTYTFCSTEEPLYASYQPITMYTNNIWDAAAPMRVVATANSFWTVMLTLRPHMLRNFSAHAQPMSSLIKTDFWSVRTIVEDGHQYWRTFFRFDGKHEVYPIYLPIYQDAVLTESYKKSLKMQFVQVRRWAWGCTDIAYVFNNGFLKKNSIPKGRMIAKFARLLESHISWSTAPLILLLAAYPLFFLHTSSAPPVGYLANQLPHLVSTIQRILMAGILVSLFLSIRSLPPKPERYKRRRNLWMVLQWLYLPLTTLVYSSFAAIYSQTRLMFGRYLGWVITEKAVKK
jgi:cellulose synthase/poly-beta-1,6-N-acetylglucosamine synthase-like glycosyltransferase